MLARFFYGTILLAALGPGLAARAQSLVPPPPDRRAALPRAIQLPSTFEPNVGQYNPRAQLIARSARYSLELDSEGISVRPASPYPAAGARNAESVADAIRLQFGATPLHWRGDTPMTAHANYFIGRAPDSWRTNVPLFSAARAGGISPGVDCLLHTGADGLEFDLAAAPFANIPHIHFWIRGSTRVTLDANGDLVAEAASATVRLRRPDVYQPSGSARMRIDGKYRLDADGRVSFRIGRYDHALPPVIDPVVSVTYMTFLGGGGADSANAVAVDASGNVYLSGVASPSGFPESGITTLGPGGASDLFVAKINPAQTGAASLVYLTFIGGGGVNSGGALALNSTGEVAVAGVTTSPDYPVTDATSLGSAANALALSVLDAQGNSLVFSTLLTGNGAEATVAQSTPVVAFTPSGTIAVATDTTSTNLAVTAGSFQPAFGNGDSPTGSNDGFLAVYSSTGTLTYLTYFGIDGYTASDSSGEPQMFPVEVGVTGIAADLVGQVYVSGFTSKPGAGFPTKNGFQTTYGGGAFDGYLMSISPKGLGSADLIYSTFIGGSASDQAFGVAVDGAIPANAYVAGTTSSSSLSVTPTLSGYQTALQGTANAFLAVVAPPGSGTTTLAYATLLGGSNKDAALTLTALAANAVYVAGSSTSPDFPTLNTLQSFSGSSDAFLAKFDTTQSGTPSLLYATLFGGSDAAQANGVAATPTGGVFITGSTTSPDFPLAGNPQSGVQPICSSCQNSPPAPDAFLIALAEGSSTGPTITFNAPQINFGNVPVGSQNPQSYVVVTNSGTAALSISAISIVGANAADFSQSSACAPPVTLSPQATCQIEITFAASIPGVENAALSFTDNATGSPQSVNLTGTGTEALASPSTPALNFGSQGEGTMSAQQVATVLNGGNSPLNIALVAITGADTAQFELRGVDTCTNPPTVAPGQTCSLGVAFAPQSVGNFSAQLQFTDNSGNAAAAVQTVTLLGAGVAASPIANVSPSAVNFASQLMNSTAAPQSVTLANTGSLALQVSAIALTGIDANEFAFASGTSCPLTGGTLNAGAQCQLNVTFTPTAATAASAAITFSDTASNSPQSVALSGTTVSASLAVAPLNLNFASQTVGIATSPQSVTISNSGTSAIQIGGITTTGSNPSDFTASYNCPGTLNAGAMCAINVAFQPTAGGQRAAVIVVSDNAPGSPQTVAVQGIGLVPAVSLSASTLTFSQQLVGTASASQSIGVSNPGTGALSISGFTLSGPNTSDFTAAQNCGTALAPGAACSVTVSYQPAAAGASSAMLTIDDNVPGAPVSISLAGAGTDYSVVAQPGDPLSVVVAAGNPATYDLQISPEDGFTAAVALACTGAPTNATCTLSTSSLAVAGASAAPFTVQIATVAGTALAPAAKLPRQPPPPPGSLPLVAVALIACLGIALGVRFALLDLRMRRSSAFKAAFAAIAAAAVIAGLAVSLSSCGTVGGGGTGTNMQSDTPPGTYTITVTGTTQGASRAVQLTLDVQ